MHNELSKEKRIIREADGLLLARNGHSRLGQACLSQPVRDMLDIFVTFQRSHGR
jgi:hypothetical protein